MKKLWSNMTDKLILMLLIYFYVSSIYNNIINYIIFIYLLMCGPWHHEVSKKESGEIKMPVWQTKDSRKPPRVTCKKDNGLDGDWLMMDTRHWFWVNWPLDLSDTLLEKVLTFSALQITQQGTQFVVLCPRPLWVVSGSTLSLWTWNLCSVAPA